MPRRRRSSPAEPTQGPPPIHVINPLGVYPVAQFRDHLGLAHSTVRRELRLGRLRVSKRAGKYFILGKWIIEWIEGGEIHRKGA